MADDLRQRYAEALIARVKQSILAGGPYDPPGMGQPFAATEYDLADAVLAVRDEEMAELREQVAFEKHRADTFLGDWRFLNFQYKARFRERETLRRRAEKAEAELAENTGVLQALRRQRDEVEASAARLRRLHFAYRGPSDTDSCAHCNRISGGLEIPWPCPTIAALDGSEEAERG